MKVLFINPPHKGFDKNQFPQFTFTVSRISPLSGITLAAYLRNHGHPTGVIDGNRIAAQFGNVRPNTYEELIRQATVFKPDLVGLTILSSDLDECRETVRCLRSALPKAIIVGGGPHPSGEPVVTLEQIPELDGIGIGPGEDICLDLANGKSIAETPGCAFVKDGQVIFTDKRRVNIDIDIIPFPAWDLIDGNYYSELNMSTTFGFLTRSLSVLTSRGCPGSCYFCSSQWNRPIRMHNTEYVLDLCQHLVDNYPIDTINFVDDTLAVTRRRLAEISEGLLKRNLHKRLKWRAHLRADQVESNLLKLMKDANCFYVTFGSESGSERILKLLNKGVTVNQNFIAAESINKAGLFFGTSVIFGVPGETEAEMKETFDFCKRINCESIGVGRFCPLPGSPSYYEFVKSGHIDPRRVDWEKLCNFSLSEGPCFADIEETRFFEILTEVRTYCHNRDFESFIRNNKDRYPDIVRLLSRHTVRPSRIGRFVKKAARRFIPDKTRQFLRSIIDS